jgi:uncharacterized protein YbjT (DUF2867 family)
MADRILVTGATGKVGRELVTRLREGGRSVRAATRNPAAARDAFPPEVEVVEMDYEATATWDAAVQWVDRIFLMPPPFDPHAWASIGPFLDWAVSMNVSKVVLLSAMDIENVPDSPLRRVEEHLPRLGVQWAILRPNLYMQNLSSGWLRDGVRQGEIELCVGDGRVSLVDSRDVSAVAALALAGDSLDGTVSVLTGPEPLSLAAVARMLSDVAPHPVRYVPVPEERVREVLAARRMRPGSIDTALALYRSVREGHREAVHPDLRDLLGRPPTQFRTFAAEHSAVWFGPG